MMTFLDLILFWGKLRQEYSDQIKLTAKLDLDKVLYTTSNHFDPSNFDNIF